VVSRERLGFQKYHIYEKKLSVETDKYLDGHRFGTIPYFPFVMGMEFFCQVCMDLKTVPGRILFSDFKIQNPIALRKDRPKIIKIKVEELLTEKQDRQDSFKIQITDEAMQLVHIEGELSFRELARGFSRDPISISEIPDRPERIINSEILYRDFFPHGPHFQNRFEIMRFNEKEGLARQYDFNKDLQYVGEEKLDRLILNPVLLDGILQLCSLYSIQYDNCFLLPISLDYCFLDLRLKKEVDEIYVRVKRLSSTTFDAQAFSIKGQELILELRNITFVKLNRPVPSY